MKLIGLTTHHYPYAKTCSNVMRPMLTIIRKFQHLANDVFSFPITFVALKYLLKLSLPITNHEP